jgi:acetyl-CoA C-acetyltransferase
MPLDPRTPVLVGAAAAQQREEDPARAREPLALMALALDLAAEDAGSRLLLERADSIRVPRGTWPYSDAGRLLAGRVGAHAARTVLANLGVLQTTLLGGAARDIAAGRADVVLVAGGETTHRDRRARELGIEAPFTAQHDARPDQVLNPRGELLGVAELRARLLSPVSQYALIENALRAAQGLSLEEHRRQVAELWSALSSAARDNPDAWEREPLTADAIREPGPGNRMLAFPYCKKHLSQMKVDQAAGLILCSLETARSLGTPRERWVFPWAVAESNHMVPLTQRRALHRSPGFAEAGRRALEHARLTADDVGHLELYSCFPCAVRIQLSELGIDPARRLSVSGGMAVAGGPLNNFVLQSQVCMTRVLRAEPGSVGMVTAVSGLMTKQGLGLWSTEPGPRPFAFDDVSESVARQAETVPVAETAAGEATIVSYTVLHDAPEPRTVVLADLDRGGRAIVSDPDPRLAALASEQELCGRRARVSESLELL